jgi:hypothetical protein
MDILKILFKLTGMLILTYIGVAIGVKGFALPNSAGADLCFGFSMLCFFGVIIILNI